ncbi:MAG: hypothetical protein ACJZ4M_01670 [Candidatus Thalassarchaeaceae archaeon]|nr:MAG: hypothetical protein CND66_00570 [Marine Group II euryarchaeote MED-G37]|tara:strand:- start:609 stop:1154 length:546 start_codon:yes stop_codon:yes gene_type:complete
MFSDIIMSSKTVSNNPGFWALIALFVGQGVIVGLIIIILGLTKTLDPFVLTSYEYGLVIEGVIFTAIGIIGGITTPLWLGLIIKDPIKFIIYDDYIEAVLPGGLISKSPIFIERHPREGVTSIELNEKVRTNDEGYKIITYSAVLIGREGARIGTLRGISSTGVAEEIAEIIKVDLSRNFD